VTRPCRYPNYHEPSPRRALWILCHADVNPDTTNKLKQSGEERSLATFNLTRLAKCNEAAESSVVIAGYDARFTTHPAGFYSMTMAYHTALFKNAVTEAFPSWPTCPSFLCHGGSRHCAARCVMQRRSYVQNWKGMLAATSISRAGHNAYPLRMPHSVNLTWGQVQPPVPRPRQ